MFRKLSQVEEQKKEKSIRKEMIEEFERIKKCQRDE
jgi:hypothetical protein